MYSIPQYKYMAEFDRSKFSYKENWLNVITTRYKLAHVSVGGVTESRPGRGRDEGLGQAGPGVSGRPDRLHHSDESPGQGLQTGSRKSSHG